MNKKIELTKEYLIDRFINKKWSYFQIYKETNWSKSTIVLKLRQFGLRRKRDLRKLDLTGKIFGKLNVVDVAPKSKKHNNWLCKCECGKQCIVSTGNLLSGNSMTCGCSHNLTGEMHPSWKGYKNISGRTFCVMENNAIRRGIYFNLTINELGDLFEKQNGKCALTGWNLILSKNNTNTASIDRIDSTKGYIIDNIQWVHKDVNKAKNTLSQDKFIEMCQAVSKYKI